MNEVGISPSFIAGEKIEPGDLVSLGKDGLLHVYKAPGDMPTADVLTELERLTGRTRGNFTRCPQAD